MILNPGTHQAESQTLGTEDTISMSIDTSDQAALMMILSENLYKDPIGSLIRESVSNALDAQREAGNSDPIIVSLEVDNQYNYLFKVQDFGTGISPERVQNILSKYAASTKRGSNEYLGYFGLGFKAPLAYTDSFMFTTIWEGEEYRYMMYKSEDGTKIDLIDKHLSGFDQKNGTTVTIQLLKRGDQNTFINKIKEQLAYFEGVYFNVPGINNDFKVLRHKSWKHSDLAHNKPMHICLEDVFYEIDWQRLGIPQISLPLGLNFRIEDGLLPIPSREDIKYTDDAKQLIKAKIKEVADYFITKFNEVRVEAEHFSDIYDKFNIKTVDVEGLVLDISALEKFSDITSDKPTLKGIKLIDIELLSHNVRAMFENYNIKGKILNRTFDGKSTYEAYQILKWDATYGSAKVIYSKEKPKGIQLEYLKDLFSSARFLYKSRDLKLGNSDDYYNYSEIKTTYHNILKLSRYPKSLWREIIKEYNSIMDDIIGNFPKLEDLQPTEKWLEERKANRAKGTREVVGNEEITLKVGRRAQRGDSNLAFESSIYKVKEIGKDLKSLTIYTTNENKKNLDKMYHLIHTKAKRSSLVIVNTYDVKKIKDLPNFITIEKFMEGKNKPFKVFATALLINKLIHTNDEVFENKDFVFILSSALSQKMDFLQKYRKKNFPEGYMDENGDEFLLEVLKVATEDNLFDEETMLIYNEVKEKLPIFNFIKHLHYNKTDPDNIDTIDLAREILRGRKFRMDWENYLQLNPEIIQNYDLLDPDEEEEEDDLQEDDEIAQIGSVHSIVPLEDGVF